MLEEMCYNPTEPIVNCTQSIAFLRGLDVQQAERVHEVIDVLATMQRIVRQSDRRWATLRCLVEGVVATAMIFAVIASIIRVLHWAQS